MDGTEPSLTGQDSSRSQNTGGDFVADFVCDLLIPYA